jgi:hypothetical protein
MSNLLYGIVAMFKRPVKSKLIGLGIAILISYVCCLYADSTLIKYISLIFPVPMYIVYLGYSYQLDKDLNSKSKTSISKPYNNYYEQNQNEVINQTPIKIERKTVTTNVVTTTEIVYFNPEKRGIING